MLGNTIWNFVADGDKQMKAPMFRESFLQKCVCKNFPNYLFHRKVIKSEIWRSFEWASSGGFAENFLLTKRKRSEMMMRERLKDCEISDKLLARERENREDRPRRVIDDRRRRNIKCSADNRLKFFDSDYKWNLSFSLLNNMIMINDSVSL